MRSSAASRPHKCAFDTPSPHSTLDFRITVIGESSWKEVISLPLKHGLPPPRISPPVAYRPEHGFLTTSTLYGRMCHILHTCTLNSSSLSACDTPVGLGLNAAAWMNQGAAYFFSFDPGSPSFTWSRGLSWRATAATTFSRAGIGGRTCCCEHMDENIAGIVRGACEEEGSRVNSLRVSKVQTVIWWHASSPPAYARLQNKNKQNVVKHFETDMDAYWEYMKNVIGFCVVISLQTILQNKISKS